MVRQRFGLADRRPPSGVGLQPAEQGRGRCGGLPGQSLKRLPEVADGILAEPRQTAVFVDAEQLTIRVLNLPPFAVSQITFVRVAAASGSTTTKRRFSRKPTDMARASLDTPDRRGR